MILITGGAGYIGSHMNKYLNKRGIDTLVFDSLVRGNKSALKWGSFVLGDMNNMDQLELLFDSYEIDAVIDFAAYIDVAESVKNPRLYYQNNFQATKNLLEVMIEHDVNTFVFSSTAAVYGDPKYIPIDEKHPTNPINAYGRSKLMVEQMLEDYSKAYDLNYVALRYFNAAGADPESEIGDMHPIVTHLIPLAIFAAIGKTPEVKIFGTDWDTPDGTGTRDYIHINDLVQAHLLAIEYLQKGGKSDVFNLGIGNGFSVREIIDIVKKISGKDFKVVETERRAGDPAKLVADSTKAKGILGWEPEFTDIEKIVKTAWDWEVKRMKI